MRDYPTSLMVFAAGKGTRMAPLTNTRPKALVQVAGRTLIDYALDLADGIETVVVNTHYLADQLEAHLQGRAVHIVYEETLLETGGGLRNALPLLGDGPVLTLNSDALWQGPNVLNALIKAWHPNEMEALLALVPPSRALGHKGAGDFTICPSGRLKRGPGLIHSGAQITTTDRLHTVAKDVFSMRDVWFEMIEDNSLFGIPYEGRWCDVGQPESIALAESMLNV